MTEKLQLPNKVIKSNWQDDIDYEPYGTNKQEMEYVSPDTISKESIERIKARNLKRGHTILSIFRSEKLVA